MPGGRIPGSQGAGTYMMCRIDRGTAVRALTPTPVPVGFGSRVRSMSLRERFIEVLRRTLPKLPEGMRDQFAQLLTPTSLEIVGGVLVVWGAGQFFGYGEVADVVVVGAGYIFLGAQAFSAGADLGRCLRITVDATTDADLDRAADYMARFVSVVGVTAFMALFFKGAKKAAPRIRAAVVGALADPRFGGIAESHLGAFVQTARETKQIIMVRFTNPESTPWISKGYPPKPLDISKVGLKTDKATGFVRALTDARIKATRELGYYVVDDSGLAIGKDGAVARWKRPPEWPVEKGQVIHPQQMKPLVGDYDLLGVASESAPEKNLSLAASNGKVLGDWTNPTTRKVAAAINAKLDQPRIMHGAYDARFVLPEESGEGAMVFFPDGTYRKLGSAAEVKQFYKSLGRRPIGEDKDIPE